MLKLRKHCNSLFGWLGGILFLVFFMSCGDDTILTETLPSIDPDPEIGISDSLPENVDGEASKDLMIGQIKEMCRNNKVPLIQLAYKSPTRSFSFESAQYDFVTASKDQSTIFQAASVSKVVFSYIALRLVDRGVLDLDKPLYLYTEGEIEDRFKNAYPDDAEKSAQNEEWGKQVTARLILTHGTGLPNWMPSSADGKLQFLNKPDERYIYSGEGIHYLQRVIEHITGMSLDELAQQEVFIPLDMKNSSYVWREEYTTTAAYGYNADNEKGNQAITMTENAAFSMRTNVKDFSNFLDALMEGKGLKKETFALMTSPHRYLNEENNYFGLGIRVNPNLDTDYGPTWFHSGSNLNFRCMFWMFPKDRTYMIYFTNSANGAGVTRTRLFEIIFPQYSKLSF